MVKYTVKSFARESKFHTYLTRETLSVEERESKFHNHGKKSSYQIFAAASMRKRVVLQSRWLVTSLGVGWLSERLRHSNIFGLLLRRNHVYGPIVPEVEKYIWGNIE